MSMAAGVTVAVGATLACQPGASSAPSPCVAERPAPDAVVSTPLDCLDQVPEDGEGRLGGDWYVANHHVRFVLRSPQDALTLRGVGGATVLDASAWDVPDHLHEALPLVDGGWLDVTAFVPRTDGADVTGLVCSLPDLPPSPSEGAERTVSYRLGPDDPWLRVEGASGWWLHPAGDVSLLDGRILFAEPAVMTTGGGVVHDTGGVVWTAGSGDLLVSDWTNAWAALGGTRRVAGRAVAADRIVLLSGATVVGEAPVVDGDFDVVVTDDVDGVRAEGPGRASSATVAPAEDLTLDVGDEAVLGPFPAPGSDGPTGPVGVAWTAADGRSGWFYDDDGFPELPVGVGQHTFVVTTGPPPAVYTLRVTVLGTAFLPVDLGPAFDPGLHVAAAFDWHADRSRDWRGTNLRAGQEAAARGFRYVVFAPADDIPEIAPGPRFPDDLWFREGTRVASEGFVTSAWPFSPSERKALHGGLVTVGLDPLDTVAALWGGPGADRELLVDLGWLTLAGPPSEVVPAPERVRLEHPGADGLGFLPWWTWLDAGRTVTPIGPVTWVPVLDPPRASRAEIEQALARADVAAGTGPLLLVTAADADTLEVELRGGAGITHLALVGPGGVLDRLVVPDDGDGIVAADLTVSGWTVAMAWSDAPDGPWVVTGPTWWPPFPGEAR
jgi:hypothetical protein